MVEVDKSSELYDKNGELVYKDFEGQDLEFLGGPDTEYDEQGRVVRTESGSEYRYNDDGSFVVEGLSRWQGYYDITYFDNLGNIVSVQTVDSKGNVVDTDALWEQYTK